MSNRDWATTPELENLIVKAEAFGGVSEFTLSTEATTRAFITEKERLQDFTTSPPKKKSRRSLKEDTFKAMVQRSRGDDIDHCEICNGYYPGDILEAVHIVDEAVRDKLLAAYKKDRSLPVSVNDCPNGLLLCGVCHMYFDKLPMPLMRISGDGTILLYGAALQSSKKDLHKTKVQWLDKLGKHKDFPTPVLLNFAMNLIPAANKRLRELEDEQDVDSSEDDHDDTDEENTN